MAKPPREAEDSPPGIAGVPSLEPTSSEERLAEASRRGSEIGNKEARSLVRSELLFGCGAPLLIMGAVLLIGIAFLVVGVFTGRGELLVTGALLVIGGILWPAIRLLSS